MKMKISAGEAKSELTILIRPKKAQRLLLLRGAALQHLVEDVVVALAFVGRDDAGFLEEIHLHVARSDVRSGIEVHAAPLAKA